MQDRIYLIQRDEWRKFIEFQDEDFVRLVIEVNYRQSGWEEINATPISKWAVLAAAKLLNIPLATQGPGKE